MGSGGKCQPGGRDTETAKETYRSLRAWNEAWCGEDWKLEVF